MSAVMAAGGVARRARAMLTCETRAEERFGCCYVEAFALNDARQLTQPGTPAWMYWNQRCGAQRRGIEWRFTFPEWLALWKASGKFALRGSRWSGSYCMTRPGDVGPYAALNVVIKTISENSKEASKDYLRKRRRLAAFATPGGELFRG